MPAWSSSEQAPAQRGASAAEQLWLPVVECPPDPPVRCLRCWLGRQRTDLAWPSGASPQCWGLKACKLFTREEYFALGFHGQACFSALPQVVFSSSSRKEERCETTALGSYFSFFVSCAFDSLRCSPNHWCPCVCLSHQRKWHQGLPEV